MNALQTHLFIGLGLSALAGLAVVGGWAPGEAARAELPVSVRQNPASYKPSYGPSYGGTLRPGGGTGSGGYSFGK